MDKDKCLRILTLLFTYFNIIFINNLKKIEITSQPFTVRCVYIERTR